MNNSIKENDSLNDYLSKVLFFYWLALLIWQNLISSENHSFLDIFIKLILFVLLIVASFKIKNKISLKSFLLFICFALYASILFFLIENKFQITVIISYFFPLLFIFLFLVDNAEQKITLMSYLIFLKLIILVVSFMAFYSVFFCTENFINIFRITSSYSNELTSFLVSSHEYGMYLVFAIISCFICFQYAQKKRRFIYIFLILFFLINLIATFSRTSILALAVFVLSFLIFSKKNHIKKWVVLTIVTLILFFIMSSFLQSFVFSIILKNMNDAGRFEMWQGGWNYFLNSDLINQIFGHGYSTVTDFLEIRYNHKSFHNAFLQILLIGGVIGELFLLSFLAVQTISFFKVIAKNNFIGSISVSLIILAIIFMLTNTSMIFQSTIDSYLLTIFTIIMPRFICNTVNAGTLESKTS